MIILCNKEVGLQKLVRWSGVAPQAKVPENPHLTN